MSDSLKTLITKLNSTCRHAAERAASICMARGHYEVDLEHLLIALLEIPKCDLAVIIEHHKINRVELEGQLQSEIMQFKNGNTRTPVFSSRIVTLLEHAWLVASLQSHLARVRSGHLLLAMLTEPALSQVLLRGVPQLRLIKCELLKHNFQSLTAKSIEDELASDCASPLNEESASASANHASAGVQKPLDQFTYNLTAQAKSGRLDPVIGREQEIRQLIDVLMRRRQNNPILTGEAGVGKTAVVEGLALKIVAGDVPAPLQNVELRVLDMGLLQAGASVKGEFENRLKNVINDVKQSSVPIILFIDEAHTMIGAGGQAGQSDAANLLKPALARGELRTIAATTWAEYKKYFEKDAALARRFQVVKVDEPTEELASAMLRAMVPLMEQHFNIRVLDEAVTEAVRLSHRYINARQLPDKAVGVLDTACAKVALGQSSTPALIENTEKELERNKSEYAALCRDYVESKADRGRCVELKRLIADAEETLAELKIRFEKEKSLVAELIDLQRVRAGKSLPKARASSDSAQASTAIAQAMAQLRMLQGEAPMVPLQVDGHVVAEIVAAWTGIPLGKMVNNEIKTVLNLANLLKERVIGQDHALEAIAQRVKTSRASLEDPDKPKGVFLFVGPSGVGKTETALALADTLYGGERKLITINMSEYQEAHTVSGLKGSPPGYVGYGEGGVLTEAVRRAPYSVVLLDEVEKAHPDVLELFFQVFDKGVLVDSEGREVDFRNTLIILTSNIGSSQIMQSCLNRAEDALPSADALAESLRPVLCKAFKPAFLGRLKVIPYYPISDDNLAKIIELKLERIKKRVAINHAAQFEWDDKLVDNVLARCTEVDSGARNVDHVLSGTLLPEMAGVVLERMAENAVIERIKVTALKNGSFKYSMR